MEVLSASTYSKDVHAGKGANVFWPVCLIIRVVLGSAPRIAWRIVLADWNASNTFQTRRKAQNCLERVHQVSPYPFSPGVLCAMFGYLDTADSQLFERLRHPGKLQQPRQMTKMLLGALEGHVMYDF